MFYPRIPVSSPVTQRHSGVWKVMWEMQQLGRRAGAADVDLTSHPPGELALLSSSTQGLDERDAANFRGPRLIG